jgi:hypothetical protein
MTINNSQMSEEYNLRAFITGCFKGFGSTCLK